MKKIVLKIGLVVFLFYSCEEIFYQDDISEATIGLLAPTDNTVFDTQHINLNWMPLEGADEFQLQIGMPSFIGANQIVLDTTLTKTSFEIELRPNEYQWRVRGLNSAYNTNYSTNSFLIVTLNPDEILKLVSPENELITNNFEQQLKWEDVSYAKNYRLQLWKPNTSGEKTLDVIVQKTDTIINFEQGNFIWQVRAENDQNSTLYSSRTILIDLTAPNTPQLLTPTSATETINKTIQFSWERENIGGSTEIDSLFIYKNEALTQVTYKERISTNSVELELNPGTYYWYVKSYDTAGNQSENSEVWPFTILEGIAESTVELISPEDNLISNTNTHNLSWNPMEYANDYRVQILKTDGTNELIFDIATAETEKEILFQDGSYNWQVKAQNATEETQYATRSILIDTKSPNTPVLVAPEESHEQVEKVIHFQYERQAIEGSTEIDSLFVYADAELNNPVLKTVVSANNHYQEFETGTYYWQLKSYDQAGNESENSQVRMFTILEDFTLKVVELIAPEDELITNIAQQTFQWNKVDGALDYRLLIHKVNNNVILSDFTVPITSKTITFEDGYYTWKVRAQNNTQNTQYTSRNILIDTTAPNTAELQNPSNEQVLSDTTVHFIWNKEAIEGSIETSTIYVYTDVELTDLVFSSEVAENSLYKDIVPGTYYWYVKTSDQAGNTSEQSEIFMFTVE